MQHPSKALKIFGNANLQRKILGALKPDVPDSHQTLAALSF